MRRRPVTSKVYELSKKRYYELYWWCQQYPEWVAKIREVHGVNSIQYDGMPHGTGVSNPPEAHAIATEQEWENVRLLVDTVRTVAPEWSQWLLEAVTTGATYDDLKGVPCGRRQFYASRRRFFCLLSTKKK